MEIENKKKMIFKKKTKERNHEYMGKKKSQKLQSSWMQKMDVSSENPKSKGEVFKV